MAAEAGESHTRNTAVAGWGIIEEPQAVLELKEVLMKHFLNLAASLMLASPVAAFACEERVVLSEHLQVGDAGEYYLVAIQRAHGDNLVGTVTRSFGAGLAAGRTVSIQFMQPALADAVCPLEFTAGETWLVRARLAGGALQVSRFNSHNVPSWHERFATYVADIEAHASSPGQP